MDNKQLHLDDLLHVMRAQQRRIETLIETDLERFFREVGHLREALEHKNWNAIDSFAIIARQSLDGIVRNVAIHRAAPNYVELDIVA